jgi:hypothetical protein
MQKVVSSNHAMPHIKFAHSTGCITASIGKSFVKGIEIRLA